MINYTALHDIFGDTLPEAHIFFATRSNKYAPSYASLRRELGMTRARTNRRVWLEFVKKYKEETAGPATVPVASISLAPATSTVAPGATQQLTTAVLPSDATNKAVTYSASDVNATISPTGLVTIAGDATPGTVIMITATSVQNPSIFREAQITVGSAA